MWSINEGIINTFETKKITPNWTICNLLNVYYYYLWSGNTDDVTVNKNTMTINSACDKKADLFMLQHEHLTSEGFDAPPSAGSTIR